MKLNFGHKIAIVYTAFALFMIGLLFKSLQMDHQLVTDNYYENELTFQGRKEAWHNLQDATFRVELGKDDKSVYVRFDNLPEGAVPSGEFTLYKPDKAELDEVHFIVLNESSTMVVKPRGQSGRYKLSVRFELNGTDYYAEKEVLL